LRPATSAVPTPLKRRHQSRKSTHRAKHLMSSEVLVIATVGAEIPSERHQRFQERHLPCRALGPGPATLAVTQPPFFTHLPVLPLSLPVGICVSAEVALAG